MKKISMSKVDKKLFELRLEINKQDRILFSTLKNRLKIVRKIALLKKKNQLPVLQKIRWKKIIEDRMKIGLRYNINQEFTLALMKLIHKESIRIQRTLQSKKDE